MELEGRQYVSLLDNSHDMHNIMYESEQDWIRGERTQIASFVPIDAGEMVLSI